ncbi:hypothetical protein Poli38472_010560 [Pythium oligandrum]|uniref:MHYT domain-containing protein n=1 Tax=Pythium oligandrum TaxID=41045 RepID=A0A8K1FEA5_PYTOL|nr:hypothetical protein Poli38472_010560 [Pythium oligandrum]|eukprot:TMW55678.1 hypothetical protein Poli38472_010560 [Pythium oligandrum]
MAYEHVAGHPIAQHWSPSTIALSYLISVTGVSAVPIQLMEQWRQCESTGSKLVLMAMSAFALGGCGIWCTHFTGMNALDLRLDDGTLLEIHFEVGLTTVSLIFPVVGVFIGLIIASTDPFFLEVEQTRRKALLVRDLTKTKMKNVVNKGELARRIKISALFSRLWRIFIGGLFAAAGVLGMHYLGMIAQRTNALMELHFGVVAISVVIALVTACAAFWILFRAHTFWPEHEALRVASALIMGIAVCGTHYSGMASASYLRSEEDFSQTTRYIINAIQLMEQWRLCEHGPTKVALLGASAFALGGCGIWCMHFTGMNALGLHLDDGTVLEMHYSAFETILSFIFPIIGVYIGLTISSTDLFFVEIEGARRKEILIKGFAKSTMANVMSRRTLARRIKLTALFSRLWRILLGGVFAALGVLSMHYMGMRALRTNASIEFHMNAVAISAVIAVLTATTAFWIIFRAHTFWPESMLLRVCSALIMGFAVCAIQLMEQWRLCELSMKKHILLTMAAFVLGGCGIWCMHFTGMNALNLHLSDGTIIDIHYEVGTTILSLFSPIIGVFIGLNVAATDPFFLELEDSRRKELLMKDLSRTRMASVVNKKSLARRIKITALFSRPWRILIGGAFAALGVLSMHYVGMMALRTSADTKFHLPQIIVSSVIAQTTATAAFWILFRALTFRPASTALRVLSAVVMGLAVCGTHYSGMWAAEFSHPEEKYALTTKYKIHGDSTSSIASHFSLLLSIQLMEQWRLSETHGSKLALMSMSAFALGGCGIWCTHFTGMNALDLHLGDGTLLEMHYEVGFTIISLIFPVVGVFVGLKVASTDPFFLEIQDSRRKDLLVSKLSSVKMTQVVNKKEIARQIKITALFSRLWRIVSGGFFAAFGVLGMHYLGMMAQRSNATITFQGGVVLVSAVIAMVTATAAFWILFRAHTFWPTSRGLRVASALIMGVAVCGTHYSGMAAAEYTHSEEDYTQTTHFLIDGGQTAALASHLSILICYWTTCLATTSSGALDNARSGTRSREDKASHHATPHHMYAQSFRASRAATVSSKKIHLEDDNDLVQSIHQEHVSTHA